MLMRRFSARRIPHRVDPVHDKVQNDLLKLNAVAEDRKRILCDRTGQFDLSSNGKRRNNSKRFANKVIQVEVFQFEGCLFQQARHPPDDFAGAPVIPQDIFNDLVEFLDVGGRRFQDCLCGFGIGQNSAERLVDFMSD